MGKCDENKLIDLIKFIKSKGSDFVIDIDSKIIFDILKYNPLVIKPNIDELELLINKKIKNTNELKNAMTDLKNKGAKNVIVSMGGDGSILMNESGQFLKASFNPIKNIKSTVGCGDTLISSFSTYLYVLNFDSAEAFKRATAFSISTACNWFLGNIDEANNFYKVVKIEKV